LGKRYRWFTADRIGLSISRNALQASAGLPIRGGGLYTALPAVLTESIIAKNTPDNCSAAD
jgi:hypothetical protein